MDMIKGKEESHHKTSAPISVRRHILTGAAIGLYFGWFFRPVREPNGFVVLFLGLLITAVLTLLRIINRKKNQMSARKIFQKIPTTFFQYAVILTMLEFRHFAHDFGGRIAVLVMTLVLGGITGWWMAYQSNR